MSGPTLSQFPGGDSAASKEETAKAGATVATLSSVPHCACSCPAPEERAEGVPRVLLQVL